MKDSNYFLHNMLSYVLRTNIYIYFQSKTKTFRQFYIEQL